MVRQGSFAVKLNNGLCKQVRGLARGGGSSPSGLLPGMLERMWKAQTNHKPPKAKTRKKKPQRPETPAQRNNKCKFRKQKTQRLAADSLHIASREQGTPYKRCIHIQYIYIYVYILGRVAFPLPTGRRGGTKCGAGSRARFRAQKL